MSINVSAPNVSEEPSPLDDMVHKAKVAQGLERGEPGSFPVSFCIIATVDDFKRSGQGLMSSLPVDAEVNVLLNEPGAEDDLSEIAELSEYPRLRTRTWTYKQGEFSFAEARNHAHDMASHDWIMWMDCDERANPAQHRDIRHLVEALPKGFGGIMAMQASMRTVGEHFTGRANERGDYEAIGQCRLYRKSTGAKWFGRCHEQIADMVEQEGYRLLPTDITITHSGYILSKADLISKLERNSNLLLRQTAEMGEDHPMYRAYCEFLTRDMGGWLELTKETL